eukprot:1160867-Pelagomonas_calceolata.AAC.9
MAMNTIHGNHIQILPIQTLHCDLIGILLVAFQSILSMDANSRLLRQLCVQRQSENYNYAHELGYALKTGKETSRHDAWALHTLRL